MPTKHEIAKRAAVDRYLKNESASTIHALAVSTAPRHNVMGVGLGPKIVNGAPTEETAVRFYVEKKVPPAALLEANLLPSEIEGVPTDVIQTGRFVAGAPTLAAVKAPEDSSGAPVRGKLRPMHPC